ncbi:MAG: trypsin-like peptidase domain-containing protein [Bacteroidota bacterium]
MIYATDGKVRSQGSGVYVSYNEIITANHVIEGYPTITTSQGSNLTVQESNKTLDATVLDSAESIKPVKIGDSDEVQLNEKVVFISSPKATINTTTWGTVIRLDNMNDDSIAVKVILNTGSSGGACFNLKGELIGIADAGENGIFFITPINDIRKAL